MELTKNLAFICPKCFHIVPLKCKFTVNGLSKENDLFMNETYMRSHYICPECKKRVHVFICDKNIAKAVQLTNKIGYKTVYSCEGHFKRNWLEKAFAHKEKNPNYKIEVFDLGTMPYIFIKGKKKLRSKLFLELCNIGFNYFSIGQGDTHKPYLKFKDQESYYELFDNPTFTFRYNPKLLEPKFNEWIEKGYTIDEIEKLFNKELRKMRKDLEKVLQNYYDLQEIGKKLNKEE